MKDQTRAKTASAMLMPKAKPAWIRTMGAVMASLLPVVRVWYQSVGPGRAAVQKFFRAAHRKQEVADEGAKRSEMPL
jgi:hypothetical protein